MTGEVQHETEAAMSEFNKLTDDAEQYVKDHPEQVHEGEQDAEHAVESKLDPSGGQGHGGQQDQGSQDQGSQQDQDSQNQRADGDQDASHQQQGQ